MRLSVQRTDKGTEGSQGNVDDLEESGAVTMRRTGEDGQVLLDGRSAGVDLVEGDTVLHSVVAPAGGSRPFCQDMRLTSSLTSFWIFVAIGPGPKSLVTSSAL